MRDKRVDQFWNQPLVQWFLSQVQPDSAVLDFGCGHFGVGSELNRLGVSCDGYDPDGKLLDQVRRDLLPSAPLLFNRLEDVPDNKYSWVIINSVCQYLQTEDAARGVLTHLMKKTRPGCRIVIADVIPPKYPVYLELILSLSKALSSGVALPLVRSWMAASTDWTQGGILKLGDEFFESVAQQLALGCTKEPRNLTVSQYRNTYVLTRGRE